jgi:hypothetical protein
MTRTHPIEPSQGRLKMVELLSDTQLKHINDTHGHCPTCKEGELIGGPVGGNSQNFRCLLCGQEFNLGLNPNHSGPYVWIGQDNGKNDNRKELYTKKQLSEMWIEK